MSQELPIGQNFKGWAPGSFLNTSRTIKRSPFLLQYPLSSALYWQSKGEMFLGSNSSIAKHGKEE